MRHPEPNKERVEPTILSIIAIEIRNLTRFALLLQLQILRYTYHVATWAYARGNEPICYRGPLCQLPLSKRAAQLFSRTRKPAKTKKIVHQQKQTTNESNKNTCEP